MRRAAARTKDAANSRPTNSALSALCLLSVDVCRSFAIASVIINNHCRRDDGFCSVIWRRGRSELPPLYVYSRLH
eukprot:850932-Prorocentrum_minimum.AAC.4